MCKIILASSSPRRKELLERYDLNPIIFKPETEEIENEGEDPIQIAMSLAFEKSYWVSKQFKNDEIIIGADTIVVYGKEVLGKPKDKEDAFRILNKLNGKEHEVVTGISIIKANSKVKIVDYESTKVKFRKLSEIQINKYIDTLEPMDKAGAYGIQGYGEILVEGINGCYSNVVGLPLGKLDDLLGRFFNIRIL